MAGKIAAAAALSAQASATLLELVGEFEATNAVQFWTEVKSVAHWLAWSCSMTLPTAREHVRVAKALRRMPTVAAAFAEGRLSYSKVREVTRVVDVVDEAQLCELALTATAAQLAVMISAFRSADGRRWPQPARRRLHWIERDDGMVELRVRLPKDEAATIAAALAGGSCCTMAPRPGPGGTPTPCKINWPNRPAARPQRCPGWTGSIIPTLARSCPGGPANPSTSTNASTPSSP